MTMDSGAPRRPQDPCRPARIADLAGQRDASGVAELLARLLDALGPAEAPEPVELRELLSVLDRLFASPPPAGSPAAQALSRAAAGFGEPALVLSGGATLGFAHLGVVAALHEAGALPRILCGSSTGAMVAGGFGCRTETETDAFFADLSRMEREGLVRAPWRRIIRDRAWLAPEALLATLGRNIGDFTFAEAHARTGRVLCIAVSATGPDHGLRVLSHRDAPDVLVPSAAAASSALPGLYPRVPLHVRGADGRPSPADTRGWRDGSLRGDLPGAVLQREFRARPLISSQANPWVLPMLALHRRGGAVARTMNRTRSGLASVLRLGGAARPHPVLATAQAILEQPYGLELALVPRFGARQWARVVANPTEREVLALVAAGREAARPHVARIRRRIELARSLARFLDPSATPS